MTEKEILQMIRQSAEDIEIPESLSPEKILEKCRKLEQKGDQGKKSRIRRQTLTVGLSAAAVFIICFISLRSNSWRAGSSATDKSSAAAAEQEEAGIAEAVLEESVEESVEETAEDTVESAADAGLGMEEAAPERQNAGELYTLAGSYDVLYERLSEEKALLEEARSYGANGRIEDLAGAADGAVAENAMEDAAAGASGSIQNTEQKLEGTFAEKEGYSLTNVQTYGIDESDVIKTDGEYIYALRGSSVSIVRAGKDGLELTGTLEAEPESGSAEVCAMYVDGDTLLLMIQENQASLEQQARKYAGEVLDISYVDSETVTAVLTYDIKNKTAPKLLGKVTQDGSYVTSRKDGTTVYLFTSKYLLEEDSFGAEYGSETIPEVNGRKVAEDCIYIGESGTRALVISSISLRRPEAARDTVMLLDDGAQVYMGGDSLYLYHSNYRNGSEQTEIAKFTMKGGYLNGAAAVSLKGTIQDTFAIHEKDHKLRVLTTDFMTNDRENCLFLLDENLKITGKLEHIAVGESIYAARYLGDMAYFITYRNTDPLFAADLSDETAPKLVGELEITGFSEYLHFWGEDKLLGLGYETDPETGERKGLKLVMFDMSDPADLKILGTKVLEKASNSRALYDYKAVLADPEENLIGFVSESYNNGSKYNYELFQWNGKGFENLLSENVKDGYDSYSYRGIYIGDRFYIAHPEVIRYYDRNDYSLKQKFEMAAE